MLKIFIIFTFLLLPPIAVISQDEIKGDIEAVFSGGESEEGARLGFFAGYNRAMHNFGSLDIAEDYCPGCFSNVSGGGFFAGAAIEFRLPFTSKITPSIVLKLGYETMPAESGSEKPILTAVEYPSGGYDFREVTAGHEFTIDYSLLTFSALYKINLPGLPLFIAAGPSFSYTISKDIYSRFYIESPAAVSLVPRDGISDKKYRYEDSNRSVVYEDSAREGRESFRIGFNAGLMYELNFGSFTAAPGIFFNYGARETQTSEKRQSCAWYFGSDFLFDI